jgi:hypothetical protein
MGAGHGKEGKPPLGGAYPPVQFTEEQAAVLASVADAIIPAAQGFPAPSAVDVVGFLARYTTRQGEDPTWYPCLAEDELTRRLDALTEAADAGRIPDALVALELAEPAFFGLLRDVVYFGYYSRPQVTRAINEQLPAGRDYRSSPQPYGYLDGLEEWDDDLLSRVRGSYLRTDQVKRLETLPTYGNASAGAVEEASVH